LTEIVGVLPILALNSTIRDFADVAVRRAAREIAEGEFNEAWFMSFVSDLFETLYATAGGIGLAATQVGVLLRVAVIALRDDTPPMVLVNPAYEPAEPSVDFMEERCLSVPDFVGPVGRFSAIRATFRDHRGRPHEVSVDGFLARVMQHEIDHLNGVLYLDRIPDKSLVRAETGGYPARRARKIIEEIH
jgi:peptide deformylase